MMVLAMDTSSTVATVALMDENKLIGEYTINHKRTHSQKLMPLIAALLEDCEVKMEQIEVIAVAEGPGSFTGLRIGAATAKGLAHAMDIPVVGISTLDALAFHLPFCQGLICPILDARRNQVYTAIYKWVGGELHAVFPPTAISIEELVEELLERTEDVVFLGDGVEKNKEFLEGSLKRRVRFAPLSVKMPNAASIAELALQKAKRGELQHFYDFAPMYLRKSEAERQYETKSKRCEREECGRCEDSENG